MSEIMVNEMEALVAKLRAENEALKAKAAARVRPVSFKVSDKGAVSVYGLGRFPVTLYKSQWDRLIGAVDGLKQFIADHQGQLTIKE